MNIYGTTNARSFNPSYPVTPNERPRSRVELVILDFIVKHHSMHTHILKSCTSQIRSLVNVVLLFQKTCCILDLSATNCRNIKHSKWLSYHFDAFLIVAKRLMLFSKSLIRIFFEKLRWCLSMAVTLSLVLVYSHRRQLFKRLKCIWRVISIKVMPSFWNCLDVGVIILWLLKTFEMRFRFCVRKTSIEHTHTHNEHCQFYLEMKFNRILLSLIGKSHRHFSILRMGRRKGR